MAMKIDRQTVDYLSQQGIDLLSMVERPGGVIDEAELQQIEDTLAARPQGLDGVAVDTLTRLRSLADQSNVMIQLEDGRQWGVRVQTGLLSSDMTVLQRHLETRDGGLTIGPAEFGRLRELAGQPDSGVDAQLLSRLARMQGTEPVWLNGRRVTVEAVPVHGGDLNRDDIEYIRTAYRVPMRNGVLNGDDYQAILRAVQRGGVSSAEAALVERLELASLAGAQVGSGRNAVRIDISTPTARELSQLGRDRNITNFETPALFGQLAQKRLSAEELALARRLVAAHGKAVQLPGQTQPSTIDARLTAAELTDLVQRFGGAGVNLSDGRLDAHDLEAITAGMARAGASPAEREIVLARLLLSGGYEVSGVEGVGEVRVAPRELTPQDVQTLEDIYGIDLSGGVIRPDHLVDVMQQMSAAEMPRGLRTSVTALGRGERLSPRARDVLNEQLERRLAVLEGSAETRPEDAARASALRARMAQLGTLPFSAQSASDQAHLRFIEELLSDARGGMDPFEQGLSMRLDAAHGSTVRLPDGRRVRVDLQAEVEVRRGEQIDQRVHDRIARDSRREKGIDFRYEGGRFILTLSSEDEAAGSAGLLEAQVRQDGRGGALRYQWNTSVPVHPDVWLGMQLGVGASYEQNQGSNNGTLHHIGLEASGGVNLRWYMNRRLGMQLNVEAHAGARAHFNIDQAQAEGALQLTEDNANELVRNAEARFEAYANTLEGMFNDLGSETKAALQAAMASESSRVSAALGPIMRRIALASITGDTAAEAEANAELDALMQGMINNLSNAASAAGRQEAQRLVSDIRSETNRLAGDLQSMVRGAIRNAGRDLASPFNFGWGVTVGGSVGWQARIPIVSGRAGALYFAPNVRVYGEAPVAGNNDQPMLVGLRDPTQARIGVRAEAGFVFQPGQSPLGIFVGGGVDQSWALGSGGGREQLVPMGRVALQFRW